MLLFMRSKSQTRPSQTITERAPATPPLSWQVGVVTHSAHLMAARPGDSATSSHPHGVRVLVWNNGLAVAGVGVFPGRGPGLRPQQACPTPGPDFMLCEPRSSPRVGLMGAS